MLGKGKTVVIAINSLFLIMFNPCKKFLTFKRNNRMGIKGGKVCIKQWHELAKKWALS